MVHISVSTSLPTLTQQFLPHPFLYPARVARHQSGVFLPRLYLAQVAPPFPLSSTGGPITSLVS